MYKIRFLNQQLTFQKETLFLVLTLVEKIKAKNKNLIRLFQITQLVFTSFEGNA